MATDHCCLASSLVQKVMVINFIEEGRGVSGQPRNHAEYAPELFLAIKRQSPAAFGESPAARHRSSPYSAKCGLLTE